MRYRLLPFAAMQAALFMAAVAMAAPALGQAPAAPANLEATPLRMGLRFDWDDPNDATIAGYEYRLRSANTNTWDPGWTLISNTLIRNRGSTRKTTRVCGIEEGKALTFQLRAVAGKTSRSDPAEVTRMTTGTAIGRCPVPAAPGNLTMTSRDGGVIFAWRDPQDTTITGYEYRTRVKGDEPGKWRPPWTLIRNSDATLTRAWICNIANNVEEITLQLRAVSRLGEATSSLYGAGGSAEVKGKPKAGAGACPPPPPPVVSFASATSSAGEGTGTRNVRVNLSPAPESGIALGYSVGGSATEGSDYTALPGTVSAAAGVASVDIPVAITDDSADEGAETVTLTLADGTGYTVGSRNVHTLTITDNDDPPPDTPVVSVAGGSPVTEGGAAGFTLTARPAPPGGITVNVNVAQTGRFAASGQTGARTVAMGTGGTATFTVRTVDDRTDEPNGAILATVLGGSGYSPHDVDAVASVTVRDDDTSGGGGGGSGGGGGEGEDRRPEVARVLEARAVAVGAALTVDLSGAFRSPAGHRLVLTASSSDPSTASVEVEGATLTVRGLASGEAEVRVLATDQSRRSISQRFAVTVTEPEAAWLLPPASHPSLQGFVRVVNHSGRAGEVTVTATDDSGMAYEPLTLKMEAHAAVHLNSEDLEDGNAVKGLTGSTGPGTGNWRLVLESATLDVEALPLLRTSDGFVTAMGETAPKGDGGLLRLATFNPASNTSQVSRLRLVNPTDAEAEATVTGTDDWGESPGEPVVLTLPPGSACEADATALESGSGLACGEPQAGLGDGTGKWRLSVESESPVVAMGLLASPTGHLSNLSGAAMADADGTWHVPLFPPASDPQGRQGFVRVINRSNRDGTVTIRAFDDTDFDYGRLTLRLGAGEAVQLNADDLEVGSAGKGLTGSTGAGTGAWRLALSSSGIDFEAHAYVRHRDGFLTAMRAVAPSVAAQAPARGRIHRVATLNPGSNSNQVGVLRLVNRGSRDAAATVTGADDRGVRPGGPVEVAVPAGKAVELTAAELESGESDAIASGSLGDGAGKWRLRVASEGDLAVLGLLRGPAGRLSNLSRSRGAFGPLPSLPPPPSSVTAEAAGHRRVRAQWAEVDGMRYGVDLLLDGVPVEGRSLAAASRTDFRWSGLAPGAYSVRVRSVDADGQAGPWGRPSNEVMVD